MIKVKHYFIDVYRKTEFEAKTSEWQGQDLSVHMTLGVGTIDM